ncbi:cardiolipin synthase [Streptococcus sp. CSL10205-OR2]|uniref:cardiolipin synthase n=1 Tax=Streptococcus sp. CSL10205-OR2 TaxID=2980558 RepID=UPI0021DAC971|nr:cardiolipin synthase [Streptococcus sp. CSL10205-OR2]MCU9533231.1 cardiolipin synthase [Streptococcus sp. CSL10205-OR2]
MSGQKNTVVKLLDKSKRGILRGVFSRLTLFLVLIILQIILINFFFLKLEDFRVPLKIIEAIVIAGSVIFLVNSKMDTTSIITWLLVIFPFPIPGTMFLIYTKNDLGYRELKKRIKESILEVSPYFHQKSDILTELKKEHLITYNLAKYLNRRGGYPIYKNPDITYFPSGMKKFIALKEELQKAKNFIFLEYFIIDEGTMWGEILAILEEKVKEGVEVRVMYDGMIEYSTLSPDYKNRLEKIGIKARAFAPMSPFLSTYYNYRDHRKILVIDNKVAFNGGVNLADEYINLVNKYGYWKDSAIMVKGEAVSSYTLMFLQMWATYDKTDDIKNYLLPNRINDDCHQGFVIPYADSPLDNEKVGENVYIDILNNANEYVHIMTPYLILDSELEHALKFAAERGVDVKIIVPGIPDKKIPYILAKRYFPSLIDSGVKIYQFTPGFVHAKNFVSDDNKAVVGTINLDYRSLYHHFECATYMYQTKSISAIEDDFQKTLSKSKKVTIESLNSENIFVRAAGFIIRLIAPLL